MSNIFKDFLHFCKQQNQLGQRTVLATIIDTQGSSYQKAGARMVISSNKTFSGILAGGCFEGDLIEQASEVFETGKAKTLFYDMRSSDDAIWGLGLGCNGAVRILLQLLDEKNNYSPVSDLAAAAEQGETRFICHIIESTNTALPSGTTINWPAEFKPLNDEQHLQSLMDVVAEKLNQQRNMFGEITIDEETLSVFCEKVLPPKHILLLGAGPDAIPLANMAKLLRWDVTIADHRQSYLDPARFPSHVKLVATRPETIADDLPLYRYNAMMLMTHSIEYDIKYLKQLAKTSIPYIGLLGPTHRRDQLYKELGDLAALVRPRSHGPVGLDIGSRTPDEIALSILAEIQAIGTGRTGQMLDDYPIQIQLNNHSEKDMAKDCHAIILAAGESSRMGQAKQLLEFQGKPLIVHACEQLEKVFAGRFRIVLGANHELISESLGRFQEQVVYNPDWQEGMASSIRTGISALPATATAAMVVLADQPLVKSNALSKLLSAWLSHPDYRVASQYQTVTGVPAVFPCADFKLLTELQGDQGARHLLNESSKVKTVALPEAAIDLDTDEDYQNFTAISA